MRRRARWLIEMPALALSLAVGGIALTAQPVEAQFFGGTAGASGGGLAPSGMYANPYMAPAMNPFLNPYAALYAPATAQNAAFFLLAANQANGGIGSGVMSGTRPRPGAQTAPSRATNRRVSDTPGAGAARYFNRAAPKAGVPQNHYNRFGNYYSTNGH